MMLEERTVRGLHEFLADEVLGRPRYVWACLGLRWVLAGPALTGDNHVFVLERGAGA